MEGATISCGRKELGHLAEKAEKDYTELIRYVEKNILDGTFSLGDRLPPERDLSTMLNISRSAVREGIRILEVIGVVYSLQGSGNYIANYYDQTLTQIMTMMFALEKMSGEELREYRYAIELQALTLAVARITERDKLKLRRCLKEMETSDDPLVRAENDKLLHHTIVEASGNRLVIANYHALNSILQRQIRDVRSRVEMHSPDEARRFRRTHRELVEAVCEGNADSARRALDAHFGLVMDNIDT